MPKHLCIFLRDCEVKETYSAQVYAYGGLRGAVLFKVVSAYIQNGDDMKKEVLFQNEVTAREYLQQVLRCYPYDIEGRMVYSLLSHNPYPHPVLLEFITYAQTVIKLHICHKEQVSAPALRTLFKRMSKLVQKNPSVLHTHQFSFDATILISNHTLSNPYAHLPFHKIPFIDEIQLHNIPLLPQPSQQQSYPIVKSKHFIYKDISMDDGNFIALYIQIVDKSGLIFLAKECLSLALGLAAMYQTGPPSLHYDFMLIFGLAGKKNKREYYFDETNELYIGLVSGDTSMHHFLNLKDMILTLYNSICLEKQDFPLHASMVEIKKDKQCYGVVFAGESGTGKSELLDALCQCCQQRDITCTPLYDDHGTLHYLDNEIVSTATEVSACKQITRRTTSLFTSFSSSLFLQEESIIYQILPLSKLAQTKTFHPVSFLFYLDNVTKKKGYERLDQLDDSIELFVKGMYKNAQRKICSSPFINSLGLVQQSPVSERLLREFFTILYIQNIPIYQLFTAGSTAQKETLYEKIAQRILKEILP